MWPVLKETKCSSENFVDWKVGEMKLTAAEVEQTAA